MKVNVQKQHWLLVQQNRPSQLPRGSPADSRLGCRKPPCLVRTVGCPLALSVDPWSADVLGAAP
eukprot:4840226-Prymnesium_polylepis.1